MKLLRVLPLLLVLLSPVALSIGCGGDGHHHDRVVREKEVVIERPRR